MVTTLRTERDVESSLLDDLARQLNAYTAWLEQLIRTTHRKADDRAVIEQLIDLAENAALSLVDAGTNPTKTRRKAALTNLRNLSVAITAQ